MRCYREILFLNMHHLPPQALTDIYIFFFSRQFQVKYLVVLQHTLLQFSIKYALACCSTEVWGVNSDCIDSAMHVNQRPIKYVSKARSVPISAQHL